MRQIWNERMMSWGMDRSRRFQMLPRMMVCMIAVNLKEEQDCRVGIVYELEPTVVVVESLISISARGNNNAEVVREVIAFLSNLARE